MLSVNSVYEVVIQDMSREGDGKVTIEGKTIFVKDAKVGDKVRIKIDRILKHFAMGHKV